MWHKNATKKFLPRLTLSLTLAASIFSVSAVAQDPSGRPPESPSKGKRTTKRTGTKPDPGPITVTLTILTDPPESEIYINGEQRGATNAEGRIQFDKIPLGGYSVEVRKEGYDNMLRGFRAGTDSPTLVFKLSPKLVEITKEFDALMAAGTLSGPDSPNAYDELDAISKKYPDRPEIAQMRGVLAAKLVEKFMPVINQTTANWRKLDPAELPKAADAATKAATLKDDKRTQAQASYLRGVMELRAWQTGSPAPGGTSGENGPSGDARLAAARAELEKAAQLDDTWAPPRYQLGLALLYAGDAAGAEAAFMKVTQLEPRWSPGFTALGSAQQATGKLKEAVDSFRKAIELDANSSQAHAGMGLARALKGEVREGIKDVERAIQLDPTSAVAHYNLGFIYSQSKKGKETAREIAKAIEEYKKAIEMNPNNLEFRNSVAEQMIVSLQNRTKKR